MASQRQHDGSAALKKRRVGGDFEEDLAGSAQGEAPGAAPNPSNEGKNVFMAVLEVLGHTNQLSFVDWVTRVGVLDRELRDWLDAKPATWWRALYTHCFPQFDAAGAAELCSSQEQDPDLLHAGVRNVDLRAGPEGSRLASSPLSLRFWRFAGLLRSSSESAQEKVEPFFSENWRKHPVLDEVKGFLDMHVHVQRSHQVSGNEVGEGHDTMIFATYVPFSALPIWFMVEFSRCGPFMDTLTQMTDFVMTSSPQMVSVSALHDWVTNYYFMMSEMDYSDDEQVICKKLWTSPFFRNGTAGITIDADLVSAHGTIGMELRDLFEPQSSNYKCANEDARPRVDRSPDHAFGRNYGNLVMTLGQSLVTDINSIWRPHTVRGDRRSLSASVGAVLAAVADPNAYEIIAGDIFEKIDTAVIEGGTS